MQQLHFKTHCATSARSLARLLASAAALASWSFAYDISINTTAVINSVDEHFDGINHVAFWHSTHDHPRAKAALNQMHLGLLRFPGGVPCHWYDWEYPLATGWTPMTPLRVAAFAHNAGARVIFQTNTRNYDPAPDRRFDPSGAHQAGWVTYAQLHGINVAFWEIGNEPEIDRPDHVPNDQDAIYAWYNAVYRDHATNIWARDPQARILAPASCNVWFWWGLDNLGKFLRAHGNVQGSGLADAISLHYYPEGRAGSVADWNTHRNKNLDWERCMTNYIIPTLRALDTRPLPLYITEWNWGGGTDNTSARTLANALGCADIVGAFRETGVKGHTHFTLHHINNNWGVLATESDYRPQCEVSPTYHALRLAALLGRDVLKVTHSADRGNVLSVYAARDPVHNTYHVMAINKSNNPVPLHFNFINYSPAGKTLLVHTLRGITGSILDDNVILNNVTNPQPGWATLPPPLTALCPGNIYTAQLPAYAMAVYAFPAAAASHFVATPTITPPQGTYPEPQNINLACATPGATIRFTTNGAPVTGSASPYAAPLLIPHPVTLRVRAFHPNASPSAEVVATYDIIPEPALAAALMALAALRYRACPVSHRAAHVAHTHPLSPALRSDTKV